MATDQLEVLNNSLTHLGIKRVSGASENKAVRDLAASFDIVRKKLLRKYPFLFAREREALTAGTIETVYDEQYDYKYTKPTGWLKTIELSHNGDFKNGVITDFIDENGAIYTDHNTAYMWFVKDNSTYTEWDATFDDLMALELAQHCAMQVTDSRSLSVEKFEQLQFVRSEAFAISARDLSQEEKPMGDFRKSRYGAGNYRSYSQYP